MHARASGMSVDVCMYLLQRAPQQRHLHGVVVVADHLTSVGMLVRAVDFLVACFPAR